MSTNSFLPLVQNPFRRSIHLLFRRREASPPPSEPAKRKRHRRRSLKTLVLSCLIGEKVRTETVNFSKVELKVLGKKMEDSPTREAGEDPNRSVDPRFLGSRLPVMKKPET